MRAARWSLLGALVLSVLGATTRTSSADVNYEFAARYRTPAQPTLLYDSPFPTTDGERAWFRTQPVFGLRISEYGPGPISSVARVVWAILFANQVKPGNAWSKPVYTSTDIGVPAGGNHLTFDYGRGYVQARLETYLNRYFGFRVGWWLMSKLETDRPIDQLAPTSPTAAFLREHDQVMAEGRAGGEALFLLRLPVLQQRALQLDVGMELNPVSFLNLMPGDTSERVMRYLGYPRTFATATIPAGPATLRVTGHLPNAYWLLPIEVQGAEVLVDASVGF